MTYNKVGNLLKENCFYRTALQFLVVGTPQIMICLQNINLFMYDNLVLFVF